MAACFLRRTGRGVEWDLSFCISNKLLARPTLLVWGPPYSSQTPKYFVCHLHFQNVPAYK